MNYTGKIIVGNDEGIREQHPWGELNKLLCAETTGDENFTFGEIAYAPGATRGPAEGHEAFHCLRGIGVLKTWSKTLPENDPVAVPLVAGTEYYVRADVPRTIENIGDEPLFGIIFQCHVDRPCHAHPLSHEPDTGNFLHYHGKDKWVEPVRQEFVEAMYLIEGPGNIASADPLNVEVRDYEIAEGSAVYHPLNTLHRQYHPGGVERPNYWIHAGYYLGEGRPTAGVFDIPEVAFWQRPR